MESPSRPCKPPDSLGTQVPFVKPTRKLGAHHKTYADSALQLCASYNRGTVHLLLSHAASKTWPTSVTVRSTLDVAASTRDNSAKNTVPKECHKRATNPGLLNTSRHLCISGKTTSYLMALVVCVTTHHSESMLLLSNKLLFYTTVDEPNNKDRETVF